MKVNIVLAAMVISTTNAASAWASSTPAPFIGIKGGFQLSYDDDFDQNKSGSPVWGVYGGLKLSQSWSWDLGYQNQPRLEFGPADADISTQLLESAIRYDWYLQDSLSIYARAGAAYWQMERTQASDYKESSGFSPLAEAGVSYQVAPSLTMSAGYQYIPSIGDVYTTGEYDSNALLLGITYTFSQPNSSSHGMVTAEPYEEKRIQEGVSHTSGNEPDVAPATQRFSPFMISSSFNFDSAETEVNLGSIADILIQYPQANVEVVGHTDSTGPEKYNQSLSVKRAQFVSNKLLDLGVPQKQIQYEGQGELAPLVSNDSPQGRAKNRRVVISIKSFEY